MASTYELIQSYEATGTVSDITFSSIPATYTDLIVKVSVRNSATQDQLWLNFNGDTSSYTARILYNVAGTSNAGSTTLTSGYTGTSQSSAWTANTFTNTEIYIPNYTSSNYKSVSTDSVSEANDSATSYRTMTAFLWSNTAAITSLTLKPDTGSFVQYSTAYLYGVKNA